MVLALGVAAAGAAAEERPLTLRHAIELALAGPAVQASEAHAEAAAALVGQARAARFPTIDASAEASSLREDPGLVVPRGAFGNPIPLPFVTGDRRTQTVGVSVHQLLYDFGRTGAALAAARSAAGAQDSEVQVRRREVALATVRSYAACYAAGRQVEVFEQAAAAADETVRVVTAMVGQGILARSDQLAAEYHRERVRADLADARRLATEACTSLTALTGVAATALDLPADGGEETASATAARALAQRPELTALARQQAALAARARQARAARLPLLAVAAGAQKSWDHYLLHESNAAAALVLQARLFDGGAATAEAAGFDAQARATAATEAALRRQIVAEVETAAAGVTAARQRVAAGERAAVAADEALRLERLQHGAGLATTRELLEAMTQATAAHDGLEAARAALVAARAELAAAASDDLLNVFGEGER
jgi:outer membrane protein TolC